TLRGDQSVECRPALFAAYAAVAEGCGSAPAQVLIRWHIQLGNIVIPKSVNPMRIASNFDAFDFPRSMTEPGLVRIRKPSISQAGEMT
ncbi:hypothetical protein DPZ17_26055, partial [Klebsiella pneumoniae]